MEVFQSVVSSVCILLSKDEVTNLIHFKWKLYNGMVIIINIFVYLLSWLSCYTLARWQHVIR